MAFHANERDMIFLLLSTTVFIGCVMLSPTIYGDFADLWYADILTYHITIFLAVIGFVTLFLAPIISLLRLHRQRICYTPKSPFFISMFLLGIPFNPKIRRFLKQFEQIFEVSFRRRESDHLDWDSIPKLTDEDRIVLRMFVERHLIVQDSGDIQEKCAWALIFLQTCFLALVFQMIHYACGDTYASLDVEDYYMNGPAVFGKALTEWTSNFVLVLFALLQIFTNGEALAAFKGLCVCSFKSLSKQKCNALVALYIASATEEIRGPRNQGSYAKVEQNGVRWTAPQCNTALLASLGEPFSVTDHQREARVVWKEEDHSLLVVKTVGTRQN